MKHRFTRFSLLVVICGLVFANSSFTRAQEPGNLPDRFLPGERTRPQGEVTSFPVGARGGPMAQAKGLVNVVIELEQTPTTLVYAQQRSTAKSTSAIQAAQAQLAVIESAQQRLVSQLSAVNAKVIYRTQRVFNGVAVKVDASQLDTIRRLSGVKAVYPLVSKTLENSSSVPLIGAPTLWNSAGLGLDGNSIKVGVIDTGVDYTHTNFGGAGLAAFNANDPNVITDTVAFPTAKVVGGYDFVGDAYNGSNDPQPDPDPLDCNGHGSHVAGTAAGFGVNSNGTTYTGPYNASINFDAFRIGPGVAPKADIYALKVFGCSGSTDFTDLAIEWAVDPNADGDFTDRLDVINMSLGSDDGSAFDTSAVASDNAAAAGVIVVASAGNSADSYYITGSPATANRVISVASSVDSTDVADAFRVNSPPAIAGLKPALFSVYYDWANSSPVTGDVVYPASQATGCATFTPANAALIKDKVVLLDWTDNQCGSIVRGRNVRLAGGIGFILADNSDVFDLYIAGDTLIPGVSTPKEIGALLKANLSAPVNVTFSNEFINSQKIVNPNNTDTLSAFSSRGPRRGDSMLKPDIAAPGQSIFSTAVGTGNQGASLSGTSMAAPHIAGSMALLRQLHPDWSVEELKALAMNTATNDLRSAPAANSELYSPSRVGAGRVNLVNAANNNVIAYLDDGQGLVSVSFGDVEVAGTASITKTVTIVNKGTGGAATYNVAYAPATTIPGVVYTVTPATVTLTGNTTATVQVNLFATASQMRHTRDVTVSPVQTLPRAWLSEASGQMTLTASSPTTTFKAALNGANEVPPVATPARAGATFSYDTATNVLSYTVKFTTMVTPTAAHLHRGSAGVSGPIAVSLVVSGGAYGPGTDLTGSVTLAEADEALLLQGNLYINVHNTQAPTGLIRAQVVAAQPNLRLPIYATARPTSVMKAAQTELNFGNTVNATAVISLTGQGVLNTSNPSAPNFPTDEVSIVTAYQLGAASPDEPFSAGIVNNADLQYVGVTSDVKATSFFTQTAIFFGVSTQGDWSTPSEAEFDIYIDTNRDGQDDFVLFNWNLGSATGASDRTDVFITVLFDLNTNKLYLEDYINGIAPSDLNTVVHNTNVMALPVYAEDLGLTAENATFDYQVVSFSRDANGVVDISPRATFNAADPAVDFSDGIRGVPAYFDLNGNSIPVNYSRTGALTSRAEGIILFHHYNGENNRTELIDLIFIKPIAYLPMIFKQP